MHGRGQKTFITSGMRADVITVAVRTGEPGLSGISLLAVDGESPGLSRTPLHKMGWLCSEIGGAAVGLLSHGRHTRGNNR